MLCPQYKKHILAFAFVAYVGACFSGCSHPKNYAHDYIAHAGGCIDGYKYTNSLEAVQNAIDKDIRYIELDLALTSDSQLVASHGWEGYMGDNTPSHEEFMSSRIFGRFTPLDIHRIDSIVISNSDINLVTDKISDPKIIDEHFNKHKYRVWVECFSDDDYIELERLGYHVMRSQRPYSLPVLIYRAIKHGSLDGFRIHNYAFRGKSNEELNNKYGDCFAIFDDANVSINDAKQFFAQDKRVRFVYVDYLE